jgi:hypothetical protein
VLVEFWSGAEIGAEAQVEYDMVGGRSPVRTVASYLADLPCEPVRKALIRGRMRFKWV